MIVDSSAIIAVLMREPERDRISRAIAASKVRRTSAGTLLEAAMVIEARAGDQGGTDLDAFIARLTVEVVPFTVEQVKFAREAFRRFGKGRHPAGLNLGDCFSYALAKATGEPLLFKGGDFAQTDIAVATY